MFTFTIGSQQFDAIDMIVVEVRADLLLEGLILINQGIGISFFGTLAIFILVTPRDEKKDNTCHGQEN
jgi:hypothetical protein